MKMLSLVSVHLDEMYQYCFTKVYSLTAQVSCDGPQSVPLNLAVSWRCEPTSTDLRIDYKYNGGAMATPMVLNNVQFLIPVDGGVTKLQAVLPPAAWYGRPVASVVAALIEMCFFQLISEVFLESIGCINVISLSLLSYRNTEQKRILWKIPDISQKSENCGMFCDDPQSIVLCY